MNSQSKVLAVVGGKAITEEDVQKTLMNLGARAAQYNNPQGKQAILDQLIDINKAFRQFPCLGDTNRTLIHLIHPFCWLLRIIILQSSKMSKLFTE